MKRCYDYGNSYRIKCLIRTGLEFRGFVHYLYCKKHNEMQADKVLERQLRVVHLDLNVQTLVF